MNCFCDLQECVILFITFFFFLRFIILVVDCSSYNLFYLYVSCMTEAWTISLTSPSVFFPFYFQLFPLATTSLKVAQFFFLIII